jgi:uncharacterized protein (DUF1919 family)
MQRVQRMGLDAQVRWGQRLSNALWRARHDGSDFSIIANNCWGGTLYQGLRRPYLTPFAGVFLMAPCYLRLLEDLRGHLAHPPRRAVESRYGSVRHVHGHPLPYPLGLLGDGVEVHFLHYATWEEALDKWVRRTARIRWDRLFVKFGDQNESTADLVRRFLALPFERKVCLTNRAGMAGEGVVALGGEGPTTRLQEDMEYRGHLDVPDWLCGGRTRGGEALRRGSRRVDAAFARAAVRRAAVRLAAGAPPEMNLDAKLAVMRAGGKAADS